ncbi:DUF2563 family protein [Mycobacterium sp. NPDC003449]
MFVDSEVLRCGAEFSRSAGAVTQHGADRFAAVQLLPKVFGDFAEAEEFASALNRAHQAHVASMHRHQSTLDALADKAHTAATVFVRQDEDAAGTLREAGLRLI